MRTVSGLVSIAADARTHQRRARLAWARSRCRSRGSSSSRMCAVPARQPTPEPLRNLTRTRGFAAMFRTQLAPCPRWATSQKVSPSRPSHGVRRGCPVRGLQAAGGGGAASTARASSAARPLPTMGLSQAASRAASGSGTAVCRRGPRCRRGRAARSSTSRARPGRRCRSARRTARPRRGARTWSGGRREFAQRSSVPPARWSGTVAVTAGLPPGRGTARRRPRRRLAPASPGPGRRLPPRPTLLWPFRSPGCGCHLWCRPP